MRQVELGFGIVFLMVGTGALAYGLIAEDNLMWYDKINQDDAYWNVTLLIVGGIIVAVLGVVLTAYGFTTAPAKHQPQVAPYGWGAPMQDTGVARFCQLCGTPRAPGAMVCPTCGRRFQ